jgi:hypothetical protein
VLFGSARIPKSRSRSLGFIRLDGYLLVAEDPERALERSKPRASILVGSIWSDTRSGGERWGEFDPGLGVLGAGALQFQLGHRLVVFGARDHRLGRIEKRL